MARGLGADERAILELLSSSDNAAHARRAHIILRWDDDLEPDIIADQLGLTEGTVTRWLRAFFEQGLDVFPTEVLAAAQTALAVNEPTTEPEELGPVEKMAPISMAELCRRYQVDMAHARHVAERAVDLFDLTGDLHRLGQHWREVIYAAGILHNIAFAGGAAKHHTRGRDILLENRLSDIADADRAVLACTTTYHRKGWKPKRLKTEPSYLALPDDVKPTALRLAALLRIADGLDFSQTQTTLITEASRATAEEVLIAVVGPYAEYDADRATEKTDMWHVLYETPLRVQPHTVVEEATHPAEPPPAVEASPLPQTPGVQPDDLMSEAGRKVLGFHFQRMLYCEPGTRQGTDIEALHNMRVATRRMRAAFRVFGSYFEEKLRRRLLRELRRTGRALGDVRDLDVFMERAQRYLVDLPAERQGELDVLFERWHRRREKTRARMLNYLDSEAYRLFVEDFRAFVETPGMGSIAPKREGPAPAHVMHVAPRQIYTRYETVRAYETVLDHAPIATLHALRIDGKHLRYTLEFFREVLGPEAEAVIATVVKLQDHLGALHDADVAQALLRAFMEKLLRKARKQQRESLNLVDLPTLSGVVAYLDNRESELLRLCETFPEVWSEVVSPETRRKLAAAVGIL